MILQIARIMYGAVMASEPRWLDKTEMAAWHSLVVAGMHMFAALDHDLRDAFDVTLLDHGILLMLRNSPEGLTMGYLAGQFGTEASVITYRVQRLEKKGLAQRRRRDDDPHIRDSQRRGLRIRVHLRRNSFQIGMGDRISSPPGRSIERTSSSLPVDQPRSAR